MMQVIVMLISFSNPFRFHRYPPLGKFYSVFLFTAGLSSVIQTGYWRDLGMNYFHETFGNRNNA
jgi:hypothetical protein